MNKRGQVTIFIILGIIIAAIVIFLIFALQRGIIISPFNPAQVVSVKDMVSKCIQDNSEEAVYLIGMQGGDIKPATLNQPYYDDYNVSYLCYTETFSSCLNMQPFLKEHIEKEMETYLEEKLRTCVDPSLWENSGYLVNIDPEYDVKVTVGRYNIMVEVNWPITITKDNLVESEKRHVAVIEKPIGRLIETVNDIVESEIKSGDFLIVPYVVSKRGQVEVERDSMSDKGKVYILNLRDNDYKFQFAVKGWIF